MWNKKPYYKDMKHYNKNNDFCFYCIKDKNTHICLSGYPNNTKLDPMLQKAITYFKENLWLELSKKDIWVIFSKNHNII